jgi:hypothetical protein
MNSSSGKDTANARRAHGGEVGSRLALGIGLRHDLSSSKKTGETKTIVCRAKSRKYSGRCISIEGLAELDHLSGAAEAETGRVGVQTVLRQIGIGGSLAA